MTGDAPGPGQGPGQAGRPEQAATAAPLALYRRYRPASFAEVKGQDHVTEPLRQALRSGRVNHAYLFSGPRGCGKTSSARILARSLNCEQGPTPDPCGVCASCVALAPAGPGSIDVIEIDAASHGGVDDARDLRERAFFAPVAGRFKIYIIDEAHMVTREGFNALLKLVEEPPPHLKFVFATTEPEKVIATIRSRTHHYPFRLVPPAILRELLEEILGSEGISYEPTVLPVVIRAGAGSVRDSLSVLDQLIAGSDESGLSYAKAVALLGYTDDRLLDEVVQAFAAGDGAAVFRAIDRVVEAGHDPRRFAADLLDRLRDLIVLAAVPDAVSTGLLDVPADRLDGMRAQADGFGQVELTRAAEIISAGLVEMRGATSPRLLLELMCAQVLLPGGGSGGTDLLSRLERLERRLESGAALARPAPAAPAPAAPAPPAASPPARQAVPAARSQEPPATRASASAGDSSSHPQRPAAPAAAAAAGSGPVDAGAIEARWPDILEAVRAEKRVAWILLASASVGSLADGVLTIEFTTEGNARGFVSSGHDQVLAEVLRRMFGTPFQLKSTARASSGGSGAAGQGRGTAGNGGPPRDSGPAGGRGGSGGWGDSGGTDSGGAGLGGAYSGGANSGGANSGGAGSGGAGSGGTDLGRAGQGGRGQSGRGQDGPGNDLPGQGRFGRGGQSGGDGSSWDNRSGRRGATQGGATQGGVTQGGVTQDGVTQGGSGPAAGGSGPGAASGTSSGSSPAGPAGPASGRPGSGRAGSSGAQSGPAAAGAGSGDGAEDGGPAGGRGPASPAGRGSSGPAGRDGPGTPGGVAGNGAPGPGGRRDAGAAGDPGWNDGVPMPEWDDSGDWEDPRDSEDNVPLRGPGGYQPGNGGGHAGRNAGLGTPPVRPAALDLIETELGGRIIEGPSS